MRYGGYSRKNPMQIVRDGVVGFAAPASRAHMGHSVMTRFSRDGKGVMRHTANTHGIPG